MILIEPTIQVRFGRSVRRRALAAFLEEAAQAARLRGEVSVLLAGDRRLRRLNREYRQKDQPTDVLSFPATPLLPRSGGNGPGPEPGRPAVAGDLAISVETAARQAAEFGHPLAAELQTLILHGVLHLAGYDHEYDAGRMARKEAALRRRFGLATGLIERSGKAADAKSGQIGGSRRKRAGARGGGRS